MDALESWREFFQSLSESELQILSVGLLFIAIIMLAGVAFISFKPRSNLINCSNCIHLGNKMCTVYNKPPTRLLFKLYPCVECELSQNENYSR